MSDAVGVNPIEAMSEAEQAEELAVRTISAAPELEGIIEDLESAVSSFVVSGLTSFDIKMFDNNRQGRTGQRSKSRVGGTILLRISKSMQWRSSGMTSET